MKCHMCESEIKEGAIFCQHCGNPIMQPDASEKSKEYPFAIELDIDESEAKLKKEAIFLKEKNSNKKALKKHTSVIAVVLIIAILIPTIITAAVLASKSKEENDPSKISNEYLTENNSESDEMSMTAVSPKEEITEPAEEVRYLEPTKEDWINLGYEMSGWCYTRDLQGGVIYDSQAPDAVKMAYSLICQDSGTNEYGSLFDDMVYKYTYQEDWQSDPLDLCDDESGDAGYSKISADNLDWMLKNIFDVSPDRNIKSISTNTGVNTCYYYGDDFYHQIHSGYGDDFLIYTVADKKKLPNGMYEITISVEELGGFDSEEATQIAELRVVAGIKETDERRYWSYSKIEA